MPDSEFASILKERAHEQLRQEREIFEQQKSQAARWFYLRLVMGYAAVLLLIAIMAVASFVLANADKFPVSVVVSSGAALFADVLGLLIAVWKIVLNSSSITRLEPATEQPIPNAKIAGRPSRAEAGK